MSSYIRVRGAAAHQGGRRRRQQRARRARGRWLSKLAAQTVGAAVLLAVALMLSSGLLGGVAAEVR